VYAEVYAMLVTACLHFGQHTKLCSVACKYLLIVDAANDACSHSYIALCAGCMTRMPLAANTAGCMPQAQIQFFVQLGFYMRLTHLSRVLYWLILTKSRVFINRVTGMLLSKLKKEYHYWTRATWFAWHGNSSWHGQDCLTITIKCDASVQSSTRSHLNRTILCLKILFKHN